MFCGISKEKKIFNFISLLLLLLEKEKINYIFYTVILVWVGN